MNKIAIRSLFLIIPALCGILFYSIQQEYLFIHFSLFQNHQTAAQRHAAEQVKLSLFHFEHDHIKENVVNCLWYKHQNTENLTLLLKQWLSWGVRESILPIHCTLDFAAIAHDEKIGYISFSHSPFETWQSTGHKLMLIESLLKTIRATNISLEKIYVLSNNKTLNDEHLDFSLPWPLSGFQEDI